MYILLIIQYFLKPILFIKHDISIVLCEFSKRILKLKLIIQIPAFKRD